MLCGVDWFFITQRKSASSRQIGFQSIPGVLKHYISEISTSYQNQVKSAILF